MKLPVSNMQGKKLADFELEDSLLVLDRGDQVLHDAVVAHEANQRAGTASTKTKAEVSGSGKKPWRQKGTGNARAGYARSPIWTGGGVAFGPKPRSYRKKLSRKAGRLAFRRAFSVKVAANCVEVIDDLALSEPKTKAFAAILDNLHVDGTALILLDQVERNIALASRNVPGIAVMSVRNVNTYELLKHAKILVSRAAMDLLRQRLTRSTGKAA